MLRGSLMIKHWSHWSRIDNVSLTRTCYNYKLKYKVANNGLDSDKN